MPSGRSWTSSAAVSRPPARRRSGVTARTVVILGLGAFGLAWSLTTTAAYLPPLGQFTGSTTLIALVLAAEGLRAALPLVIGPWSDTFHTPLGRRAVHARRPRTARVLSRVAGVRPSLWTMALVVFAFSSPTTSTSRRTAVSTRTS